MTKTPLDQITTEEQARELAIDWQTTWQDIEYSYSELIEWADYFTQVADKFKLHEEFRENGII